MPQKERNIRPFVIISVRLYCVCVGLNHCVFVENVYREGKYIRERVMMRIMREGRGKKDKLEFTHIVGVFGIPIAQHVVVIY